MSLWADTTLIGRAIRAHYRPQSGPFKLTAAVTYTCNQRCTHCRIWKRTSTDELSAGEWRRIWRSVSSSLSWLDLTGGEVTDRPDFVEIAVAALEECDQLAMLHYPSNGSRPEALEETTRAILGASPERLVLSISLDGPEALHNKLRGDKRAFANAIESFNRVRSLGVDVYFGMTLSAWNVHAIEDTVASLAEQIPGFTWRDLHINVMHVSSHYFGNDGIKEPATEALTQAIERIVAERGRPRTKTELLEYLFLRHVPEHLQHGRSPLPCHSMSGHAFINPKGEVYPCHIWDRPVGSLREFDFSLDQLWRSEMADTVRNEVSNDACPGCWTPCEAYPTILANLPRV